MHLQFMDWAFLAAIVTVFAVGFSALWFWAGRIKQDSSNLKECASLLREILDELRGRNPK